MGAHITAPLKKRQSLLPKIRAIAWKANNALKARHLNAFQVITTF